ncbi:MAG: hypothetical protein VXX60_05360 [Bacteroidota bacterium]|nr:hypothetical protein [Bacteroidota bacterium]
MFIPQLYYKDVNIYTNVWYNWNTVAKSSGEALKVKGYGWFKWENGKAVKAYNALTQPNTMRSWP